MSRLIRALRGIVTANAGRAPRTHSGRAERGGTMPQRPRRAVLAYSIVAALLLTVIGALPAGAAPPDRLIVFNSDSGNQVDLWTMRTDGTGLARLTNDKVPDDLAEWSPNRKQIAWTRGGEESPTGEIWVMNADGTGKRQVTSNNFSDNAVSWSPDGRQLAYRSNRDDNDDIYVINVDGTNERRLTTNPAMDFLPDWSPDGMRITFTRARIGASAVYTMNAADGSDVRQLTDDSLRAGLSVYSPDGSQIAFADNFVPPDGEKDVWVMNADGSGLRQVTNTADLELPRSWSPDGTRVAADFHRVTSGGTVGKGDIAVVTVATGATVNLTNTNSTSEGGPDWQP
jgi:Tol biopolymer transport system component